MSILQNLSLFDPKVSTGILHALTAALHLL